jgi:hypothetical protein
VLPLEEGPGQPQVCWGTTRKHITSSRFSFVICEVGVVFQVFTTLGTL